MKKSDIPPTYKLAKGYQAMYYSSKHCDAGTKNGGWTPLSNGWGYPYTYKGFAINKCKRLQSWRYYTDAVFQVIELSTGEVVWQCENLKELGFNN
jgi:hypothetical protein